MFKLKILSRITLGIVLLGVSVKAKEPKEDEVYNQVRKFYRSIQILQCRYREIFVWALTGETVVREGELVVTNDNRMRIESPEMLILSDGKTLYRWNKLRNQVLIEAVKEDDSGEMLPRRVLLEFGENLRPHSLRIISIDGEKGYQLELLPRDSRESSLASASLWITTKDLVVRKLEITDFNQNRTTYILSEIKLNSPMSPQWFNFTMPEGAEIFDLR